MSSEAPPTPENSLDLPASGASAFLGRVAAQGTTPEGTSATPSVDAAGVSKAVRQNLEEYAWARGTIVWLVTGLVIGVILVVVMFIGAVSAANRPEGFVKGTPSLTERMNTAMEERFEINKDSLDLYINLTLPLLDDLDEHGAPQRDLLKGIVHPSIIMRANQATWDSTTAVKKYMIVQLLHIESIGSVVVDQKENRVSAYVRGYYSVSMLMAKPGTKPARVPYRARVVVEPNTPSSLDPEHFYMIELRERVGQSALKWDTEQELQK